ncbi:MAG: alpha,alpha-trehalase [Lentisphaeria bacterium]|nr:alpha,alpha-trehalase [Lentisphaeria bacterium]
MQKVLDYIAQGWEKTTRFNPVSEGTLIGLPHPYTVPCIRDSFQELYYWDTYFACRGMALQGRSELVRDNCEDFISEVNEFGFVPNGNRTYYLDRSQPPFLGAMIELTGAVCPEDRAWLRRAARALEVEMHFWKFRRRGECGLHRYGTNATEEELEAFYPCCVERLGYPENATPEQIRAAAREAMAEAESGWDFNPRFERRCPEFAAIDLNSLLVRSRNELGELYRDLGDLERSGEWFHSAEIRAELIRCYCWNDRRGVFLDFNFAEKRHSKVFSCASLFPLWCGIATQEQAESTLYALEHLLECRHGLAACEPNDSGRTYQWDYPNGWPPLHFIAIEGLDRYGFTEAASRIARKYVDTVTQNFEKTGALWEKYNVVAGSVDVKSEYETPQMLGWTAGTFVYAADYLEKHGE